VFESSCPFPFFDYFRVPYKVVEPFGFVDRLSPQHPLNSCGRLRRAEITNGQRTAYWLDVNGTDSPARNLSPDEYRLESIPIFGRVLPDTVCSEWLTSSSGDDWFPVDEIRDRVGRRAASVWQSGKGSVFLPFDPAEIIGNYWSERYREVHSPSGFAHMKSLAVTGYYRARPFLPRSTQITLRRLYSRVQRRARFPRWPIESALQDFYRYLFRHIVEVARVAVPWIEFWPYGHSWALVLTHDVETRFGYDNLDLARDVERRFGYRSSWNFVPRRYPVKDSLVAELLKDGFEVGVHGLYHDGRDLESLKLLDERLPLMHHYAERWNSIGFRSPATQRVWDWMPDLGFEYDSSYPDTDPFEPQAGGCCSLLPYFNQGMVELPITLPQDHTLFVILRESDETLWVEKTEYIKSEKGMALIITHPDYLVERRVLRSYTAFLGAFKEHTDVWRALPRDVSGWWRRRAHSRVIESGAGWRITGPASEEATIEFVRPSPIVQ
jgi:hypothetical protein